jgi:hypothetical protein
MAPRLRTRSLRLYRRLDWSGLAPGAEPARRQDGERRDYQPHADRLERPRPFPQLNPGGQDAHDRDSPRLLMPAVPAGRLWRTYSQSNQATALATNTL